jgi:rhamnose transport system permease protein
MSGFEKDGRVPLRRPTRASTGRPHDVEPALAVRQAPVWRPGWRREYSSLIALCLLLGYLAISRPAFFAGANIRDILLNNSYVLIAAIGETIVILTGGIDISIGAMLAVCSVTAGELATHGVPVYLVALATLAAGSALGLINGACIAWLDAPPIIVTLGTLSIFRGAVIWYTHGYWIQDLPAAFRFLGEGSILSVPIPIAIAGAALLVASSGLLLTRQGRYAYAVGSSPTSAELAGIPVKRVRFGVYVLSGFCVGLASLTFATRFSQIQSNTGVGFELLVITAVVVGGVNIFGAMGSVWGALCGVLLLGAVHPALAYWRLPASWEGAIQGGFILAAIAADALRSRRR